MHEYRVLIDAVDGEFVQVLHTIYKGKGVCVCACVCVSVCVCVCARVSRKRG
jgi:hypothetical protein